MMIYSFELLLSKYLLVVSYEDTMIPLCYIICQDFSHHFYSLSQLALDSVNME